MNKYFKGYYYKHQKGQNTLSIIAGETQNEKFVQVITKDSSYYIPNQSGCTFSKDGISVNINYNDICLNGKVKYYDLTPINYDIMGPFKFVPMECKHEIVSMNHKIIGGFTLNGKFLDFTDGSGYIEGDKGSSFPKSYFWIECNNYHKKYSIVASAANIPFGFFHFKGTICNINYLGKEYRLATYLGAKITELKKNRLCINQRKYKLVIDVIRSDGKKLIAPKKGKMEHTIYEDVSCTASFKFYINNKELFNITNDFTSFEYVV